MDRRDAGKFIHARAAALERRFRIACGTGLARRVGLLEGVGKAQHTVLVEVLGEHL